MRNEIIVYLVDDDEDDRMFTRDALEGVLEEVSIREFKNGIELLNALHDKDKILEPSLIVMDINMPFIDGLDVLTSIRCNPLLCHIPVMLFSTSADCRTIKQAYQLGVNAYLIKPAPLPEYQNMAYVAASCFINPQQSLYVPDVQSNRKTPNLLVIEDNADHWDLMQLALAKFGDVQLVHQASAEAAMMFLKSAYAGSAQPIDLIILDLYLPGRQQGLDLIEEIRGFFIQQKLAPVPIIVFSASDHKDDIKATYQRNANAYIPKSMDVGPGSLLFK